jgi:hypothetical protein
LVNILGLVNEQGKDVVDAIQKEHNNNNSLRCYGMLVEPISCDTYDLFTIHTKQDP